MVTREQVEQLLVLSEEATSAPWKSSVDYVYQAVSEASVADMRSAIDAEVVTQSRNLMPQLALDWLQKDADIRQLRTALEALDKRGGLGLEWHAMIRQALADIDAVSGSDVEEGATE